MGNTIGIWTCWCGERFGEEIRRRVGSLAFSFSVDTGSFLVSFLVESGNQLLNDLSLEKIC